MGSVAYALQRAERVQGLLVLHVAAAETKTVNNRASPERTTPRPNALALKAIWIDADVDENDRSTMTR